MANKLASDTLVSLREFNKANGLDWDFGDNWNNQGTEFETYVNHYLFPKINETNLLNVDLGNRFDWLAKEIEFISQFTEEYVFLDSVPINLDLDQEATLFLEREYPKMASKLYGNGVIKKTKFTLNNNSVRLNFNTLADAIAYALGVYKKRISDINVFEELEIKGMLVDYSLKHTQDRRIVGSIDELVTTTYEALLNLQNNSHLYNETSKASGGTIGRYTTRTDLTNTVILTSDKVKTYMLDTKIGNTFNAEGLDITKHIISFADLGGNYQLTKDVTITEQETVNLFKAFGDYQTKIGTTILKNSVLTFDVSNLKEFKGNIFEIKPKSDLYAYVFDVDKIRYQRNTKGMIQKPFENPEFGETTHWIHYYTRKLVSPFYNNILITGAK